MDTAHTVGMVGFQDAESGDEAFAYVRITGSHIALALSLREDGDIEVFMPIEASVQLMGILQEAIALIRKASS